MYDYNNGRFLSVDPFIQAPTSTQSMNPYTYIFNNPLSGTDPTGYISSVNSGFESYSGYCGAGVGCFNSSAEDDNGLILVPVGDRSGSVSLSDINSEDSKFNQQFFENISGVKGITEDRFIREFGTDSLSLTERLNQKLTLKPNVTGTASAVPEQRGFHFLWDEFVTKGFGNLAASLKSNRTNPLNGQILSEGQAFDEAVIGILTLGVGNRAKTTVRVAENSVDGLTDLFRAVSPEELTDIVNTGTFNLGPSAFAKQFGFNLDEIVKLADFLPDTAAVVKTKISTESLKRFDHTPVDQSILRSGSLTIHPEELDGFNKAITDIEQVF